MFTYRGYLGWIRDVATAPCPLGAWPVTEVDEALLADYEASFAMQGREGLDISSIWGLAVGRAWPLDIESSLDAERAGWVRRLLERAHRHGVRVLAGTGVYSWGFEEIIRAHPELSGGNRRAMCASNPDTWPWMRRVLDFVAEGLEVDGFSFQSADQGRCPCERCARWGDVEYHARLNARVIDYVRGRWPDKIVAINTWGMDLSEPDELPHAVAMTRQADYLIDAHGSAARKDPAHRGRLIAAMIPCAYGTVGGPFVEPPQHWERDRWFLPCLDRSAAHLRGLAAEGGQAMEVFFHVRANPGDEVSVLHTARLLRDPGRASEEVLCEVLAELYGPRDQEALTRLAAIFRRADAAYFGRAHRLPTAATISMEPLVSDQAGPPVYLIDRLDHSGLDDYEADIQGILGECDALLERVEDKARIERIAGCLQGVLADVSVARAALPA